MKLVSIQVAFYKAPGNFLDKTIRWWSSSIYSHCEILLDGGLGSMSRCVSSSPRDGGVREASIFIDPDRWDVFTIEADPALVQSWFDANNGKLYDWLGIAGFVLRAIPEIKSRWFCSEACAAMLGFSDPWRYDPATLASALSREVA